MFALFLADDSAQLVEPLNAQYSDFASLLSDVSKVDNPFVKLVQVNDEIAYQLKQDGEVICTYAGFSDKAKAKQ